MTRSSRSLALLGGTLSAVALAACGGTTVADNAPSTVPALVPKLNSPLDNAGATSSTPTTTTPAASSTTSTPETTTPSTGSTTGGTATPPPSTGATTGNTTSGGVVAPTGST